LYHHHHLFRGLCSGRLFFRLGGDRPLHNIQPFTATPEIVQRPHIMSSCFPNVAPVSGLSPLCRCCISAVFVVPSRTSVL
jgi:hypothetical protein